MKTLSSLFYLAPILSLPAQAAVLTFDIDALANSDPVNQDYGDRITATTMGAFNYGGSSGFTPNVELSYSGRDLSYWTTGYSTDLSNVLYDEPETGGTFTISFTADAGFQVSLQSFNIGNFGTAVTLPGITVRNGGGTILYNESPIALGANTTPSTSITLPDTVQAQELVLEIDTSGLGGNNDNVGIDNIEFSQVAIPEPSALVLIALGIMSSGLRRRR